MRYLLIHGSWHGAWAWSKLVPLLQNMGHEVICSDLPGSGDDADNAVNISYADLYAHVFDAIKQSPEPLVIVAHSFAGMLAAQACEELHERVHHIFYIAAWLPQENMSLFDKAVAYNNSNLPSIFRDVGDPRLRALDSSGAKDFFYHDCSDDIQDWASKLLRPKAAQPDHEKMPAFKPTYTLPKSSYILCNADRAVNPISQRDMAVRFGFSSDQIKIIKSSHSPFLSKPEELAQLISY